MDSTDDKDPWVSSRNTTLVFDRVLDGQHTLTVRAREHASAGGSSDVVSELVHVVHLFSR